MRNKFFSDIYIIRRTKKQYLVYVSHCCISLINKTKKTNNLSRVQTDTALISIVDLFTIIPGVASKRNSRRKSFRSKQVLKTFLSQLDRYYMNSVRSIKPNAIPPEQTILTIERKGRMGDRRSVFLKRRANEGNPRQRQ